MRRSSSVVASTFVAFTFVGALAGPLLGAPKKWTKKPTPKPTPTIVPAPTAAPTTATAATSEPTSTGAADDESTKTPEKPEKTASDAAKFRVVVAACPASTKLKDLDARATYKLVEKTCRALTSNGSADGTTSAPGYLSSDDLAVVACARGSEVVAPEECGVRAVLEVPRDDGPPHALQFVADGAFALSVKTERVEKAASPPNGTGLTVVVDAEGMGSTRTPVSWRRGVEGYGAGRWIWFPLPMLTTDFSASPQGYRLGVTPLAAAAGAKIFPSNSARGYVGLSGFVAWNLLVPNDTQTLSNGTQVRINFKAFGAGAMIDASGWFAVGLGVGHTFTTDARTDFRVWLFFGPRLLSFLGG